MKTPKTTYGSKELSGLALWLDVKSGWRWQGGKWCNKLVEWREIQFLSGCKLTKLNISFLIWNAFDKVTRKGLHYLVILLSTVNEWVVSVSCSAQLFEDWICQNRRWVQGTFWDVSLRFLPGKQPSKGSPVFVIGITNAKVTEFHVALPWGVGWVLYHFWGPKVII